MKEYQKYTERDGVITDSGTQWLSGNDVSNWPKDTALIEVGQEPTDFSPESYTIENGKLVKATASVIKDRQRLKELSDRESVRSTRKLRYESEQVTSLYWDWQESGKETDKEKWIEAKDSIRKEFPYL